jgi:hypothetical protein
MEPGSGPATAALIIVGSAKSSTKRENRRSAPDRLEHGSRRPAFEPYPDSRVSCRRTAAAQRPGSSPRTCEPDRHPSGCAERDTRGLAVMTRLCATPQTGRSQGGVSFAGLFCEMRRPGLGHGGPNVRCSASSEATQTAH